MSEHRLDEIVIERPRNGMRISLRKITGAKKKLDRLTEIASEDGLLSPYLIKPTTKTKHLSDHLGPLRRFLRSKVGQPWDVVYSQLCQRLDTSTMTGQHVLSHLWNYVERYVNLIDGIPYSKPKYGLSRRLDVCHYQNQFYIHPETGILCVSECIPWPQTLSQPQQRDIVILDAYHQYHKLNEIWYLITFEPFPDSSIEPIADVFRGLISRDMARSIQGQSVYAAKKRQCNKREIRFILTQLAKL